MITETSVITQKYHSEIEPNYAISSGVIPTRSAKKLLRKQRSTLNVSICSEDNSSQQSYIRDNVAQFIHHGFVKAYGAQVKSFLPHFIYLEANSHDKHGRSKQQIKAALGVRSAKDTLFIEQYLTKPVEQYQALKHTHGRHTIAEIGNLYGTHRNYTLPLFMIMGVAMFAANYSHLVFSATTQVCSILKTAGVEIEELAEAKSEMLEDQDNSWGSYYQTTPKVIVVSLLSVMQLIETTPKYKEMFAQLQTNTSHLAKDLKRL